VAALEFSADGRLLASGDSQGTVNIWQTLSSFSGQEVAFRSLQKIAFKGAVGSIAFSPDSKYIAVGGSSAYVVLLQLEGQQSTFPAAQVRGFACSQADESQLSSDEWKNYFGAEPLRYTCGPGNQHAAR
jgi:WD40 repeat protein